MRQEGEESYDESRGCASSYFRGAFPDEVHARTRARSYFPSRRGALIGLLLPLRVRARARPSTPHVVAVAQCDHGTATRTSFPECAGFRLTFPLPARPPFCSRNPRA